MTSNKHSKQVTDFGISKDHITVVRYMGAKLITEMMNQGQVFEAYIHAQLSIEKILWDKIVGLFKGEKAMLVRRTIDNSRERFQTSTYELIKWANYLGAINNNEFSDLIDFNKKRNNLIHGHGLWHHTKTFREALKKGIRFLGKNNYC
ncbi:MAG: hypothetical protein ACE5KZ_16155 [Candidatus Scalinduaceae bacterium]